MFTEPKGTAQNVRLYNVLVEARSNRGSKALERHDQLKNLVWTIKKEFYECIMLWHVTTDICYYKELKDTSDLILQECYMSGRDVSWKTSRESNSSQ